MSVKPQLGPAQRLVLCVAGIAALTAVSAGILGVVGTTLDCTIIQADSDTLREAYKTHLAQHPLTVNTGSRDLAAEIKALKIEDGTLYQASGRNGEPLQPCSKPLPCLVMRNNSVLQYDAAQTFGGTAASHAVHFNLDPDGKRPHGRMTLALFADGHLEVIDPSTPETNPANLSQSELTRGALTANASEDASMAQVTTDPTYLQNWS
ncbi:MAG TPA: hypothetical protein V6C52_01180 [Coleofasciculaceae cyanobacterium]|jgi:hypothetical protein